MTNKELETCCTKIAYEIVKLERRCKLQTAQIASLQELRMIDRAAFILLQGRILELEKTVMNAEFNRTSKEDAVIRAGGFARAGG